MSLKTDIARSAGEHECCYHLDASRRVLADRERELLELKGPCSNKRCRLHYAHSGPCDVRLPDREHFVRAGVSTESTCRYPECECDCDYPCGRSPSNQSPRDKGYYAIVDEPGQP